MSQLPWSSLIIRINLLYSNKTGPLGAGQWFKEFVNWLVQRSREILELWGIPVGILITVWLVHHECYPNSFCNKKIMLQTLLCIFIIITFIKWMWTLIKNTAFKSARRIRYVTYKIAYSWNVASITRYRVP